MKVVVFDLGGTLMQYIGMPYSWVDYYRRGLQAVAEAFDYDVPETVMAASEQMLKDVNPRVNPRTSEYPAERIFANVLADWRMDAPVNRCIDVFWQGLELKAEVYPDTWEVLPMLKERGFAITALTDLPSALPDRIFRQDIGVLLDQIDFYVSSEISGRRKPDPEGLRMIAEKFGVPVNALVFIGDEEKDRQTAENAGCRFVRIRRGDAAGDGIHSLYELLDMLL